MSFSIEVNLLSENYLRRLFEHFLEYGNVPRINNDVGNTENTERVKLRATRLCHDNKD